jgi:hypothetical protein
VRDGWTLDHFDAELSDRGRVLTLTLTSGEITLRRELRTALMIYRGVFKPGDSYELGDTVTWAGSLWHCNGATVEKPGDGETWTLAVKKGRDGKDGVAGAKGEPGPQGRAGHDLTQMTPEGVRY